MAGPPAHELVLDALDMAISQRQRARPGLSPARLPVHLIRLRPPPGRLRTRRLDGTVGDALDNAVAESFFATLECELLDRSPWPARTGLRTAIFDFIEVFYNRQRRYSTLDYHPPAAYEQHHASTASAA